MDKIQNYDEMLLGFEEVKTPLFDLMLKAKSVEVASSEVDHYNEVGQKMTVTTTAECGDNTPGEALLSLSEEDIKLIRVPSLLLVPGNAGYDSEGKKVVPGASLMLLVKKVQSETTLTVLSLNGRKINSGDEFSAISPIPAGTSLVVLPYPLDEEPEEFAGVSVYPTPRHLYLGKRHQCNQMAAYFECLKKCDSISNAASVIAELANLKTTGSIQLLVSCGAKLPGVEPACHTMTGVMEQVQKKFEYPGESDRSKFLDLLKMYFGAEGSPKSGTLLAGAGLLARLLNIGDDLSGLATPFGELKVIHEPAFDKSGYSDYGILLDESSLIHYVCSEESGIWEALCLDGDNHILIAPPSLEKPVNPGVTEEPENPDEPGNSEDPENPENPEVPENPEPKVVLWDSEDAPTVAAYPEGGLFMLAADCSAMGSGAVEGTLMRMTVSGGVASFEVVSQ